MAVNLDKIDLLIFDCDGVLVDSEMLASNNLARALNEQGLAITPAESRKRFTGRSMASVIDDASTELGRPLPDDFLDQLREKDIKTFEQYLKPLPNIAATLSRLTLKRCVASSGSPEKIRHSLTLTGLIDLFEPNLFSTHSVRQGKPAPDLFLFAAKQMKATPKQCLVIEDSIAGVQAARAAGMKVVAFAGGSHVDDDHLNRLQQESPDALITEMTGLIDLLQPQDCP